MIKRRKISKEEYFRGRKHVWLGVLAIILLFGGLLLVAFRETLGFGEWTGATIVFTSLIPIFFLNWNHIEDYNLYLDQEKKKKKVVIWNEEEIKNYLESVEVGEYKEKKL